MGNVKLSKIISLPFTNEACAILVALQATDNSTDHCTLRCSEHKTYY